LVWLTFRHSIGELDGRRAQVPLPDAHRAVLPTKGRTAVSFDDDFRRLGGKEVHIVTADVPGAREFDRGHPNSGSTAFASERVPWLKPESLLIYAKFLSSPWLCWLRTGSMRSLPDSALPEGLWPSSWGACAASRA